MRIINNKSYDYRLMPFFETEESIILFLEYGESSNGVFYKSKTVDLEINKNGETDWAKLQEIINENLKEFENGNLLD